ncbi:MAG: ATP-binding protein [Bacilli bacterium]|nr:ATP-binding protein [Bacilli bacterium]
MMLGNIIEINDNKVTLKLSIDINSQPNLVNLHVIFEDKSKRIVGEVSKVTQELMFINIVGEIENGVFISGGSARPSFMSKVRIITLEELELVFGSQVLKDGYTNFGTSNVYANYKINVSINEFFSNHFAIIGNSGAGKSCTVSSIIQKLFRNNKPPVNSSIFFFDAYGEYNNAFSTLHTENNLLNYKSYTTNPQDKENLLRIPIWLLDVDDLALLLDVDNPAQLPIIEKTLKLVPILTGSSENTIKRKNDIIARAVQDILLSGNGSVKIHDQVIAVLTKFNTESLNLETQIVQPGYTRTLKQCLFVDKTGKMQDMEVVVEFIRDYIIDEDIDIPEDELNKYYSLQDLELANEFALISEGILKSDKVFDYANVINVRLHTLASGENAKYFTYDKYVDRNQFIDKLLIDRTTGGRCQLVNFNINYVDDRIAKVITKIISKMLFVRSSLTVPRGSKSYHIIVEEAHRYVQNDRDVQLLGYNIFERITKEGRKYGCFLGLITQRPSELSDTCISQCSNFIAFRTLHPKDLSYIKEMVPNVTSEIILQLKNLKPGNCIAFGSAFKVPTSLYIDIPNPRPLSNNVDLQMVWYNSSNNTQILSDDVNVIMATQIENSLPQPTTGNKFINYVDEPIKEITDSNISSPSLPAPNQNLIQNNS